MCRWGVAKDRTIGEKGTLKSRACQNFGAEAIVAIGNPERHMRKASHCGSKQQ